MNPQSAFEAPDPITPRKGVADAAARTRGLRNRHAGRARLGLLAALVAVATLLAASAGSSALAGFSPRPRAAAPPAAPPASAKAAKSAPAPARRAANLLPRAAAMPFQAAPLSIFDGDCAGTSTSYQLGSTICAKIGTVRDGLRIAFVDPGGFIREARPVTSNTNELFTLPTTLTDVIASFFTTENRGTWQVTLINEDASLAELQQINVRDTANVAADVAVTKGLVSAAIPSASGQSIVYDVVVENYGPDDAANVQFTDATPSNTTFSSYTQLSGPTFTCATPGAGNTGTTTCTVATLPWNANSAAVFEFVYQSSSSTGVIEGGDVAVTSDTADITAANNEGGTPVVGINGSTPAVCTLACPSDITVAADTTQDPDGPGGNDPINGANVSYGAPDPSGDCGSIQNDPDHPSGSFFPAGTTAVTITSTGGGSCTFNVTVIDAPPPTISCPADKNVDAGSDCSAAVDPGAPSTTGTGVTVIGARSDGAALDALYPAGNTTITWTATDSYSRHVSCSQVVHVTSNDTTAPTITAPADVNETTGSAGASCGKIVSESVLGAPDADDNCTVHVTRTGVPAGNFFPVGTTTITYTATDGAGNTATATQKVTITETSPPVIFAPPDASYTCLSDVPAASPSQARGPVLDSQGQPVLDDDGNFVPGGAPYDNCGAPVVTVTEASTGAGTAASPRVITRTFKATDASGNMATAVQTITVTDSTPPTISCPADITVYLPLSSPAVTTAVSYATPSGSDNCSGATTTQTAGLPSGAQFPVGTTVNTYRVTDAVGNYAECSFSVTVLYNFTGFFQPVDNLPTLNVVNAGKAIPVKFSLSGNKGLNIFAANSPNTVSISCDGSAPQNDVEETVNAGGSSLSYSATSDQYNYVWKTESAWAGTCRQLVVKLNDGSEHRANFKFR
jgi:uncharacterized repeat protein (TIGR01451 family)